MIRRVWEDDEWDILIRTIKRGDCILMLGPDASLEKVKGEENEDFRPLNEILAKELAERIKTDEVEGKIKPRVDLHKIDHANLAQVAHYYCIVMETGRDNLEARAEKFYEKRMQLTSELHEDLAALPFYFTVTSCPDRMFYNALEKYGKKPVVEQYNFHGTSPGMVEMGSVEEPLLFNLYGTIDDPDSLVLTENDLVDFLVAVVSGNPPLPIRVISELHESKKSFLFLGFGFEHWYLRVLLHVLQGDKKRTHSFALEQFSKIANEDEFQQTILFFEQSECKIHIYTKELKTFVKDLRERYEKVIKRDEDNSRPEIPRKPSPVEPGPTVFICHANENKDFASFLYEKLEAEGFKPWLDKESLRGGDEWNNVIKKAIEKEIDYVVVLQSNDLAKKIDGYVNEEIKMALDRQKRFRHGIRFIIPVKIEACNLLEELEHLQAIDLSGKKNIEKLIITIRRDQKKRKGEQ